MQIDSLRQHCLRANYLQQYQGKMARVLTLTFVYKYCYSTYLHIVSINANSKKPHLPFSFKLRFRSTGWWPSLTGWQPSWISGLKWCHDVILMSELEFSWSTYPKVSSYMLLGALVQKLRFRSTRSWPSWIFWSKWCHSIKLMSESESSWTTYTKVSSYVFGALV